MREPDERTRRARAAWRHRGDQRPAFAVAPRPGQESVWDYPRPPVVVDDQRRIRVLAGDTMVAETQAAKRVLETASPPTFYIPPRDVRHGLLSVSNTTSFCEWKGTAHYYHVQVGATLIRDAAWFYPDPFDEFRSIAGYVAFYPEKLTCWVDQERVEAQGGGYYGGWVTQEIVGPWKGQDMPEGSEA